MHAKMQELPDPQNMISLHIFGSGLPWKCGHNSLDLKHVYVKVAELRRSGPFHGLIA